MDIVCDDPPNDELVVSCDLDRLVIWVVRNEPSTLVLLVELVLLSGKLAVHACDNNAAVVRLKRTIYDHNIAIENARFLHAVSCDAGIESGFWMADNLPREVDGLARMVLRRIGKARVEVLRQFEFDAHGLSGGEGVKLWFHISAIWVQR